MTRKVSEQSVQIAIITYLRYKCKDVLFSASVGGMHTSKTQAVKAKLTGYSKGCPDLMIFEPRGGYMGLFLEVKRDKKSYPTAEQKNWLEALNKRGYLAKCVKGFDEAKEALDLYFG